MHPPHHVGVISSAAAKQQPQLELRSVGPIFTWLAFFVRFFLCAGFVLINRRIVSGSGRRAERGFQGRVVIELQEKTSNDNAKMDAHFFSFLFFVQLRKVLLLRYRANGNCVIRFHRTRQMQISGWHIQSRQRRREDVELNLESRIWGNRIARRHKQLLA